VTIIPILKILYSTVHCVTLDPQHQQRTYHLQKSRILQQKKYKTMSRGGTNGSKVVMIAVATTLAALGVGTVYLPFYVDRDKLRGMHEDADSHLSEKEKKEYAMLLSQLHEQEMNGGRRANTQQEQDRPAPTRTENSMWARMKATPTEKK
jgi:hypothetical protein